jgi:hypothetical protein
MVVTSTRPRRANTTRVKVAASLAAILTAASVAGCSPTSQSSPSVARPSTPPPVASGTPGPVTADERAAVDAYHNMWRAYTAAVGPTPPSDDGLSRYAAGHALSLLRDGLRTPRTPGLDGVGDVGITSTIVDVSPTALPGMVTIRDCLGEAVSHIAPVVAATPFDDPAGRLVFATVSVQTDGSWKVSDLTVKEAGTCRTR